MAITHLTNASPGAPTLTGAIGSMYKLKYHAGMHLLQRIERYS